MIPTWFLIVYGVLCVLSFVLFVADKAKAKAGKWRIPENTLLVSAFFGAVGATLGMLLAHHKTRKPKFKLVYVFLAMNIVVIAALFFY